MMRKLLYCILFFISAKTVVAQDLSPYVNQLLVVGKDRILAFEKYYLNNGAEAFQHLYLSTNSGVSWVNLQDSTPYDGKTIVLSDGSLLHGSFGDYWSGYAGLYRSTNLGKTWKILRQSVVTNFAAVGTAEFYADVALKDPSGGIAGSDTLLVSTDAGQTWKKCLIVDAYQQAQIQSLAAFHGNLYVSVYDKILRTNRSSYNWDTVCWSHAVGTDSTEFVSSISSNSDKIFCQGLILKNSSLSSIANTSLLISSSGDSSSWVEEEDPFYHYQTWSGIPIVAIGNELLSMGMLSCDLGKTWVDFSKNLKNVYLTDSRYLTAIAVDSFGRFYYGDGDNIISTSDCGSTWHSSSLANASVSESEKSADHFSIYPNPASQSTTITYSLPHSEFVKIELIDQLGRVVRSVFDGYEEQGEKNVLLSLNDIPDGIYYLRMQNVSGITTAKISIAK
jgi:photosystem II stability/assembly factor-like uncharacterized protein